MKGNLHTDKADHSSEIGKVYIGSCPEAIEIKEKMKETFSNNGYLVVDLGGFDIEDRIDCAVLGREVAEKVLENVLFKHDSDIHGEKILGIMMTNDVEATLEVVSKFDGIKAKLISANDLDVSSENLLIFDIKNIGLSEIRQVIEKVLS